MKFNVYAFLLKMFVLTKIIMNFRRTYVTICFTIYKFYMFKK